MLAPEEESTIDDGSTSALVAPDSFNLPRKVKTDCL